MVKKGEKDVYFIAGPAGALAINFRQRWFAVVAQARQAAAKKRAAAAVIPPQDQTASGVTGANFRDSTAKTGVQMGVQIFFES